MHKLLQPRDDVDRLYESRKDDRRGIASIETALTHQNNYLKTAYKSAEKDWLQPSKTVPTTRWPTERQPPENKNGKKNNSTDVLRDK